MITGSEFPNAPCASLTQPLVSFVPAQVLQPWGALEAFDGLSCLDRLREPFQGLWTIAQFLVRRRDRREDARIASQRADEREEFERAVPMLLLLRSPCQERQHRVTRRELRQEPGFGPAAGGCRLAQLQGGLDASFARVRKSAQ